jgi:heme-degrading monooxygenase HmoA
MWIQILRLKFSGQAPQGSDQFEKNALPMLKQAPGFIGVVLLANRETGEGGSVAYWQDQQSAEAAESNMAERRKAQLSEQGMKETEVHGGELVLTDVKDPNRQPQAGLFLRSNDATMEPAKLDQVIALMRDKVIPELRKQPGYVNCNMIANRQTGRSIISSGWETAEQRKASNAAVSGLRREAEDIAGAKVKVEEWKTGFTYIPPEALAQVRQG